MTERMSPPHLVNVQLVLSSSQIASNFCHPQQKFQRSLNTDHLKFVCINSQEQALAASSKEMLEEK